MSRVIDVFLEGTELPIGRLSSDDQGALTFRYTQHATGSLSLALPLREEAYQDAEARAFFDNLLPENASLENVISRHQIARSDVAGLLFHTGRDCAGAVSCVPAGEGPGKWPSRLNEDYDLLPDTTLAAIMRALRDDRRLPAGTPDPSPLAGTQGKIAVTRLPGGGFAFPRRGSGAATTHIIKVPRRGEDASVDREIQLMRLARDLRIHEAADVESLEIEDVRGVLVTRFDRKIEGELVRRIHQEDFCQALGLPRRLKYERHGNSERRFSASAVAHILARTQSPAVARRQLLRMTLFNLAVGNTDNHAKNHALIYPGKTPVLAPLYDVTPIMLNPNVTHEFAFKIGNADKMHDLTPGDLISFARAIGIKARGKAGETEVRRIAAHTLQIISTKLEELQEPAMQALGEAIFNRVRLIGGGFGMKMEARTRISDESQKYSEFPTSGAT